MSTTYMRPLPEQVQVVKGIIKGFGMLFSNEPRYVEGFQEASLVLGEYEIIWLKNNPIDFCVYVGRVIKGSFTEPDDYEVVELASFDTLYQAVEFIAKHHIKQVFNEFMEGESEYRVDMEIRNSFRSIPQGVIRHG